MDQTKTYLCISYCPEVATYFFKILGILYSQFVHNVRSIQLIKKRKEKKAELFKNQPSKAFQAAALSDVSASQFYSLKGRKFGNQWWSCKWSEWIIETLAAESNKCLSFSLSTHPPS